VSGRVVRLGTDVHQQVQALLPWYVGARLDAQEHADVEAHLAECSRCQAELAWELQLHADAAQIDVPTGDADQGFARLRERMAGTAAAPPRRRDSLAARLWAHWRAAPAWTRWALAGQLAVVALLGGLLLPLLSPAPQFRALGGPAAAPAAAASTHLIVRFRPETTEQEMRRLLRESQARLVDGPTTTDAYLLAVPAGMEAAAVRQLRAQGAVLLVESLDGRAAR
jgi:Putative zinc-finger